MVKANPEALIWARESANLSREAAAARLCLGGKKTSSFDVLSTLESGERLPSTSQLQKMVKLYHRPFITFFLETPPRPASMGEDFRQLSEEEKHEHESNVQALVRNIYARQSLVKEALIDSDSSVDVSFIGSGREMPDTTKAVESITNALEIDISEYRKAPDAHKAFSYLRNKAEKKRNLYTPNR